jgi:phosphatidylserine/phosphatidylglycerophosphate/cardiolipin synthase-like enzyme
LKFQNNSVMKKIICFLCFTYFLLIPTCLFAIPSDVQVYFTPGDHCAEKIINEINHENNRILVQAYQFTAANIAKALVQAKRRGVTVKIILDKSQYRSKRYSSALFFDHMGIPVWIDHKPAIAHNKILILGNHTVITGSYNFSKAAENRNAENLLIIKSKNLAERYSQNFDKRLSESTPLSVYEKIIY